MSREFGIGRGPKKEKGRETFLNQIWVGEGRSSQTIGLPNTMYRTSQNRPGGKIKGQGGEAKREQLADHGNNWRKKGRIPPVLEDEWGLVDPA